MTKEDADRWLEAIRNIVHFADHTNNMDNQELLFNLQIANLYRTSKLDNFELNRLYQALTNSRRKKQINKIKSI